MTRLTGLLFALGMAVLVGLVLHIGPGTLAGEIHKLGLNLLWILLPSVGVYLLDALGWRYTLDRYADRVRFSRLFMTRMAGEAVNFTTPAAYLGGEPMKAYMLSRYNVPLVDGLASVITAKTTMTLAEVLFILVGVGLSATLLSRSGDVLMAGLVGVGLLGFGIGLFVFVQRQGLFGGVLRLLERLGIRIAWLRDRESKLRMLDEAIGDFYKRDHRRFFLSFLAFFGGWTVGTFEVYLTLYFLELPVDVMTAVAIEALAVFVKGSTAFVPGSIGGQEAGIVLLCAAFGFPEAGGVTFALVRRVREIIWVAFGLLALTAQSPAPSPDDSPGRPPA
jgi:putative membrane protein